MPKPSEIRMGKNREYILDTAVQLILERGFENVSLREIARQADYSPAALYRYFENKASISAAALERESARLLDALNEAGENGEPCSRLVDMCMVYIQFNLANPVFTILLNNLFGGRESFEQPAPEGSPYTLFLEAVRACIDGQPEKNRAAPHPEVLTYWLWSMIHGMATLQSGQLRGFDADFPRADRNGVETLLKGALTNAGI